MALIGYHASHELYAPSVLLRYVRQAERAGFRAGMCSDHLHPWTPDQGHSGYSFAWLGAALQATTLPLGTICCPVFRYHPAIVAQAAATLAEMFPDRMWLALGTGQALNEHVTGEPWPSKPERQAKVQAAADVIRRLWAGETVTRKDHVRVEAAKVYSRPARPPQLFGAATTAETARWVGGWADGLLTVNMDPDTMRNIVAAFRDGGGAGKPMFLQSMTGYDPDEARAWQAAHERWPIAALGQADLQNTPTPEALAAKTKGSRPDDLKGKLRVSSDLGRHRGWIEGDLELGFERIFIYDISHDTDRFIDAYGEKILPAFRQA